MSFIINQNFDLKSPQFNFVRDYFADLAALKAADENDFPDHFITNVGGLLYQLTKSNSVDSTTGKWRKIKLGSDVNLSGYATKADLDSKASKSEAIKTLDIAANSTIVRIRGTRANNTTTAVDIPLAAYEILTDNNQKAGLVTGAERKIINELSLGGTSQTSGSLDITLGGVENGTVSIPFAKKGMSDTSYGLITGVDKKKLDGIAEGANKYTLPKASSNLGGIKIGYSNTTSDTRNYGVQLDSDGKAYVNVPWVNTDTKYSLPIATKDVLGGIKIGFTQNDTEHNYPLVLSTTNQAYVKVPLATYNILNDTGQKDGLITGAERKAINSFSLSGQSVVNSGLQLTLNGVIGDNNATVTIPFATSNMDDISYGLMMGSDKKKLDGIAISTRVSSGSTSLVTGGGIYTALSGKVDKAAGKDLSTNDFTTAYKTKLDNITNITKSEIDNLFT